MKSRQRLGRALLAVFAIALFMGPGPGIWLINPDPGDPEARRFLFGVPIVYAWAVFWLAVQSSCVVVACWKVWSDTSDTSDGSGGEQGGSPP